MFRSRKTVATVVGLAAAALATTAGPAAAADDARGKSLEAGIEAYQNAYPKISLEAASSAARQQEARKELYGFLQKGGEQTFGGATFDPPSGVLKVFATSEEIAGLAGETGKQLGLERRDADRQAELLRPGAPGRGGARPRGPRSARTPVRTAASRSPTTASSSPLTPGQQALVADGRQGGGRHAHRPPQHAQDRVRRGLHVALRL